jgi:hypothetical protein
MPQSAIHLPIHPLIGIGPFKLGSSRDEIRRCMAAIGLPFESERGQMDYCCSSSIQVEYDDEGATDFIGTSFDERILVTYEGQNVFDLPAEALFELINTHEDKPSEYNDYEHVFPSQIVTLWDADSQYDRLGGEIRPVWAQVGVGSVTYLKAIRKIQGKTEQDVTPNA